MSEDREKLFKRAEYLRNLLIAHVTGRTVNMLDYQKLRQYFMQHKEAGAFLPRIVINHSDLSSVWQSMKYGFGSHEERRAAILDQFQPFLERFSPQEAAADDAAIEQLNEVVLFSRWNELMERVDKEPELAVDAIQQDITALCYQLLKELKVFPDPRRSSLSKLVTLTEHALQISPDREHAKVVKDIVSGCADSLAAIEHLYAENSKANSEKTIDKEIAKVLVSLYISLSTMLLSSWRLHRLGAASSATKV